MIDSKIKRLLAHANWWLLGCTVLLCVVGLVNLYSASSIKTESGYYLRIFFERQLIWVLVGFVAMIIVAGIDYKIYRSWALPILVISMILLLLVPFVGVTVKNAKRWISFGFFNFQPSEAAKIGVLMTAAMLMSRLKEPLSIRYFLEVLLICSLPCTLIIIQPDLGTTLNLLLLLAGMILYHGFKFSVFLLNLVALPMAGFVSWFFLKPYQKERILTFLDPSKASPKAFYHIKQSKIAIGSGEMWGKSFMEGMQSKLLFLPESHTDFAIAVFCEEWGFVGAILLLFLFSAFLLSIALTAKEAKDKFGNLLCVGVFFYFFWQFLINIGMVTGTMPVVGIPLPFISYGGTTTVVNFIMLGLVINVSMRRFMFKSQL